MLGWEVARGAPHLQVKSPHSAPHLRSFILPPSSPLAHLLLLRLPPRLPSVIAPFPLPSPRLRVQLGSRLLRSLCRELPVVPAGRRQAVAGGGGAASGSGNLLGSWQQRPRPPSLASW